VTKARFVVDPPKNKVHIIAVEEDNPSLDETICGEVPTSIEGEWADLVEDRAGLYPVPIANVCMKCFPNLRQFQYDDTASVVLDL
jgi:hypothetical protein